MLPPFESSGFAAADDPTFAEGEGANWVIVWTEDGAVTRESYVNLIPTSAGGTHEAGLREGLFGAVRAFIDAHQLLPKGVKLLPEDVFARASFVLSAKVLDPQFQGQVKERLLSRDAVRLVSFFVRPQLEFWLNHNPNDGRRLAELVVSQAQARARAGQKIEKKKSSAVAVLPGKLTDCESTELARNELFLVEGDSAGGSAKMGRDKEFQAILPLRGKVLNTWEVERDRLFGNAEVHDMAVAIGVDPHGPNDDISLDGLAVRQDLRAGRCRCRRFAHPSIAADAVLPSLSPAGASGKHLRRAAAAVSGRRPALGKRPTRRLYCLDEAELDTTLEKLVDEKVKEGSWSIARFKGLGEMSPEQLWETTMNPGYTASDARGAGRRRQRRDVGNDDDADGASREPGPTRMARRARQRDRSRRLAVALGNGSHTGACMRRLYRHTSARHRC